MNIRLEGVQGEISEAERILSFVFDMKKPSKFYPNARGSVTDSSGRVYIAVNSMMKPDIASVLTNDLLSLAAKYDRLGEKSETDMIRKFHDAGQRGMPFGKLFSLYEVLRDRIISKPIQEADKN